MHGGDTDLVKALAAANDESQGLQKSHSFVTELLLKYAQRELSEGH